MPKAYEAMRDKFAKTMGYDKAQSKAAAIYNSKHKSSPVTGGEYERMKKVHRYLRKK